MSAAKPRYEILWTETARTDVEEIARFIAHDSVENALAVLDRLEHSAENLAFLPERGRFVPELKQLGVLAYREIIVRMHLDGYERRITRGAIYSSITAAATRAHRSPRGSSDRPRRRIR